jgi:membrane protease YdiL (CAAX protease family)
LQSAGEAIGQAAGKASAATGLDIVTLASFVLAVVVLVGLWFAKVLRPGALGAHGLRKVDAHPWWVWLLCGLMVFWSGLVGAVVVGEIPALTGPAPLAPGTLGPARYQGVTQVAMYAVSLAAAGVLIRLLKSSAPQAGFTATWKSVGVGVLCLLMAMPVVNSVGALMVMIQERVSGETPSRLAHPVLELVHSNGKDPWAWVVVGMAVLVAPVQEEILFRGFLQSALLRLTGRPWWSIVIASVIFGAMHLGTQVPWYAVVPITVLGLGLGLAFERTRSLGTSIAMHVGFNAFNTAVAVFGPGS